MTDTAEQFFPYRFDRRWQAAFLALGVKKDDGVTITESGMLQAKYGRFKVETPLSNVASTEVTGPHRWYTAVGLRLSGTDDSITFGTNHRLGLSILFTEKVRRVIGLRRHSTLWVSVAEPEELAAAIGARADLTS
ncbi:MAG: hypothetical protein GY788_24945 [bacterium]|nr:hypothetical protein [bacterium]